MFSNESLFYAEVAFLHTKRVTLSIGDKFLPYHILLQFIAAILHITVDTKRQTQVVLVMYGLKKWPSLWYSFICSQAICSIIFLNLNIMQSNHKNNLSFFYDVYIFLHSCSLCSLILTRYSGYSKNVLKMSLFLTYYILPKSLRYCCNVFLRSYAIIFFCLLAIKLLMSTKELQLWGYFMEGYRFINIYIDDIVPAAVLKTICIVC